MRTSRRRSGGVTRATNGSNAIRSRASTARGRTASRRAGSMKSSAEPRAAAADVDVELLKAVAQAWHAQSGNPRPSSSRASPGAGGDADAGARPRAGAASRRPSRFKLEAMAAAAAASEARAREGSWDFAESLWDTYELVAVARKLESGLAVADHAAPATQGAGKPRRESSRSLRSLLLRSTSRRFEEPEW